jgi:hypothetical protein
MTWNDLVTAAVTASGRITSHVRHWPQSSPFAWMIPLPPVSKGRAGQIMVAELMQANGYSVTKAKGIAQSLAVTKGVVKVKVCLEWDTGAFVFEQIEDDNYDFLAMLGLRHHDAFFWLCSKPVALTNSAAQHKRPSRWVVFQPTAPPAWLAPHGGHIGNTAATLTTALGPPP